MTDSTALTSLELCAGAGGQALGLERAGFQHLAALEVEAWAVKTLLLNRPQWNPIQADIREVNGKRYKGVDLLAGGVPCPPFSVAGRQLGQADDRDLFPAALEWISEAVPRAVMLENVPGLATRKFEGYREDLFTQLRSLGFKWSEGRVLQAADFGVPQLRPRFIIVALRDAAAAELFVWPAGSEDRTHVGDALYEQMASGGWKGAKKWRDGARRVGPTLVGGSKLHGGPDLGPTRAKQAWRELGVDGMGIANEVPGSSQPVNFVPRLTVPMAATIQGFPSDWRFAGAKTAAYRQVGNAFPPPVAQAVGTQIGRALGAVPPKGKSGRKSLATAAKA